MEAQGCVVVMDAGWRTDPEEVPRRPRRMLQPGQDPEDQEEPRTVLVTVIVKRKLTVPVLVTMMDSVLMEGGARELKLGIVK